LPESTPGLHRVLKFGGSSVGSAEKLGQVVNLIAAEHAALHSSVSSECSAGAQRLVIVVSAAGDTTDWLIDAADLASAGHLDEGTIYSYEQHQTVCFLDCSALVITTCFHFCCAYTANLMVDKVADLAISNGLMCCQQAATATAATAAVSVAASNSTAVSNGVERETFSAMSIVVAVRELLDPLRQLLLGMSLMREKTPQVSTQIKTC
jgi:Amino acid kinase family